MQETRAPPAELRAHEYPLCLPPPAAPTRPTTTTAHVVADPYRWLEDPDSPETPRLDRGRERADVRLPGTDPRPRTPFEKRLTALWDYERYGTPYLQGGRYFYGRNDGLQNQSVLYVTETLDAAPRVLLDPNTLSADGTVALAGYAISEDGKFMAYGLAAAGSDWTEWHVRDVDTGEDLADHLRWVKFSGASWAKDGSGLLLQPLRCAPPKARSCSRRTTTRSCIFHALGTPQEADVLVYERPDQKEWGFGGYVSEDGAVSDDLRPAGDGAQEPAVLQISGRARRPRRRAAGRVRRLLLASWAATGHGSGCGPTTTPRAGASSPWTSSNPDPAHWREVIPEAAETLEGVSLVGERFIAAYLKDACTQVKVFGLDGDVRARRSPCPASARRAASAASGTQTETFYSYTSYTVPTTIYRYDIPTGTEHGLPSAPGRLSTPTTTRRVRSSTPAKTARASRCS